MSKRKKNKRTPEQMAEIYRKQRLAMERNNVVRAKDEVKNGEKRAVKEFGKTLLNICLSHCPINATVSDRRQGVKGQSPTPVTPQMHSYMKEFAEKSEMELTEVNGAFYSFNSEFGLVILADNHKKIGLSEGLARVALSKGLREFRRFGNFQRVISLEWIVSNPKVRCSGWGDKMLETMTSLADEYDFDIALHCCNGSEFKNTINKKHNFDKYLGADTGSMDNGRLTEWYGKHGFDLNPSNAGDYIKDGDKLNLEFLFRPSKLTKDFKFPTLFSKKVEGENVSFSYGNTLKHFKKLAMVA
tara:strand:- start:137 stop:1036 length:900 start_codon:yes stop_codon:yes gene_type:complete